MIVLAPSRGRPERALEMVKSFLDTKVLDTTKIVVVIDETDLTARGYDKIKHLKYADVLRLWGAETGNLTKATNSAAKRFWGGDHVLGHVGDDHLFRTEGWDHDIERALYEPGIAYGDDLLQGEALPTAAFMSAIIPRTLGWMALPSTNHLYIDNAWKKIGEELGVLHYLPSVVIEHMHPAAGKAESDEGYEKWNSQEATVRDSEAYINWEKHHMDADIETLRMVIS